MTAPAFALRSSLGELPERMRTLPIEARGYPVPWFVAWRDGVPDFRITDQAKLVRAVKEHLCWLCGQRLGSYLAFVVGPMCAVNMISSEPPSHRECAEFAARTCPFLSMPNAKRRAANLPDDIKPAPGMMIERNPGVTLVWITKSYNTFAPGHGNPGVLFKMGAPHAVLFFAEGRTATRAEVLRSIDSGIPLLRESAEMQGPRAVAALERSVADAMRLVPAAGAAEE